MTTIDPISVPVTALQTAMMDFAAAKPAQANPTPKAETVQTFVKQSSESGLVTALQAMMTAQAEQVRASAYHTLESANSSTVPGVSVNVEV